MRHRGGYNLKSFNYEAYNAKVYQDLKMDLQTHQSANHVIEHLQQYGKLPDEYVTKRIAETKYGWKPGTALKKGQIGGDIYRNEQQLLPTSDGRVWFEADVGINNQISRINSQEQDYCILMMGYCLLQPIIINLLRRSENGSNN